MSLFDLTSSDDIEKRRSTECHMVDYVVLKYRFLDGSRIQCETQFFHEYFDTVFSKKQLKTDMFNSTKSIYEHNVLNEQIDTLVY